MRLARLMARMGIGLPGFIGLLAGGALVGAQEPAKAGGETNAKSKVAVKAKACPNDDSGLKLPAGFCATIFADGIGHARHMVVGPDGVVYVNTWSGEYYGKDATHDGGFLVALQDKSGSGKADVTERFGETVASGGAGGTGIGIYKGALYVEINDKIVRYALEAGSIVPKGGPTTIVSGLPLDGDHPMHPFIIGNDGGLYIDVASASNACQLKNRTLKSPGADPCVELETRGGIWKYDANKTDQMFSKAERYATGIRNGEGFAFDAAGRLYVTQHGRDQLKTNWPELFKAEQEATLPSEEVMLLKKGGDYGWPECYFDGALKKLVLAPEYGGDGGKKIGVCAQKTGPAASFPAHWAPNGMAHYDGSKFPARYKNGLFVAFHGSWNRAPYPQGGYNVVFQPMAAGHAVGRCEVFADEFAGPVKSPDGAKHRPSGLAVGADGSLYVSDDVRGRIYRIVYMGAGYGSGAGVRYCPSEAAPAGAIEAEVGKPPEGTHEDAAAGANAAALPAGVTTEMIALGKRVYRGRAGGAACSGCHGGTGQGSPLGPDLQGKEWLWSDGSYDGVKKTIAEGVEQPKKYRSPMPAMGGAQLTPEQLSAVAAYVWSLSHSVTTTSSNAAAGDAGGAPAELVIPGKGIFPESLTSTRDGRIIIGSIGTRTIFVVKPGGAKAERWIPADPASGLGVLGVFADEKSNTLWACFSEVPPPNQKPTFDSVLKTFDLRTGALKSIYAMPTAGAFCNDIAVGADGTAYASDTENMEVVRLPKGGKKLEVWAGNGGFGPKGGVLDGISVIGNKLYVNTLETNKVFSVPIGADGKAGAITEMKLSRAIEGPDGMRSIGGELLLVEGGGKGRLSRIKIDGDNAELTTLNEGYPDGAVSVAVVGKTAYVLEAQWGAMFPPAGKTVVEKPYHATAVSLGKN